MRNHNHNCNPYFSFECKIMFTLVIICIPIFSFEIYNVASTIKYKHSHNMTDADALYNNLTDERLIMQFKASMHHNVSLPAYITLTKNITDLNNEITTKKADSLDIILDYFIHALMMEMFIDVYLVI